MIAPIVMRQRLLHPSSRRRWTSSACYHPLDLNTIISSLLIGSNPTGCTTSSSCSGSSRSSSRIRFIQQHPSRKNNHTCRFLTAASSISNSGISAIKVTQTSNAISCHENSTNQHANSEQEPTSSRNECSSITATTTTTSSSSSTNPSSTSKSSFSSSSSGEIFNNSKSPNQIAEEEILSLQSELRAHFRHASYDTALETAARLLSLTTTQFGRLHPATASAYNNLGLMNKCLGKYVEAKEAYHEALRIYGEVCGKDHASYAAALSNLGMLERGRVLESEGSTDDDDDDDVEEGGGVNNEEDGIDLEELRDNNKHEKPTKLSALERMQLNETAIEYFDEAYRIRLSELGKSHPHTITSRSQLGAAMAAAVVAERRGQVGGLLENELRRLKELKNVRDPKELEAYVPEALARAASKTSLSGSKLTRRRWEAAEDHLRGALTTAVENPRGESVHPLMYIPIGKRQTNVVGIDDKRGLASPSKEDTSGLSKKDKKQLGKERLREKRRAVTTALLEIEGEKMAVLGVAAKVTTLSAATAAQNLAVFLKNYADWIRLSLMNEKQPQQTTTTMALLNKIIHEAQHLYESALHVRSSILPSHHPDVIATKFSLAELLDSARVSHVPAISEEDATAEPGEQAAKSIDGVRANELREEILNTFNVEEREGDGK